MTTFTLSEDLPSCSVRKELIEALETYFQVELAQKLGQDMIGSEHRFALALTDPLGTETLGSIKEHASPVFTNGTSAIVLDWSNTTKAEVRIDIAVRFVSPSYLSSLKITCTGQAGREFATLVRDSVFRIIQPYRNLNWVLAPAGEPLTFIFLLTIGTVGLAIGVPKFETKSTFEYTALAVGIVAAWGFWTAKFVLPRFVFDTPRQRTLSAAWKWATLGVLSFLVFGSLLPAMRKAVLGF